MIFTVLGPEVKTCCQHLRARQQSSAIWRGCSPSSVAARGNRYIYEGKRGVAVCQEPVPPKGFMAVCAALHCSALRNQQSMLSHGLSAFVLKRIGKAVGLCHI